MKELLVVPTPPTTKKDFASDQEVRWCPGCGDYSILAQMQKVMPELGIRRENIVFISGIGCSSRFPYYMDTYGIHSIHGRAPTLATGLKVARPDLTVFIITGDGDGLSIGGNHLLHVLRRNVNVNIVLFNNRIYGLTKGQASPTSLTGAKTKSSPMGTVEQPLNPISVALAAEATFVARSIDVEIKHLGEMLKKAAEHKGASFVEVLQNCNIFNDGAWDHVTDQKTKKETQLILEHGKPMVFGANRDKGIWLNRQTLLPEVVTLGGDISEADLLVHDESRDDATLAYLLSRMNYPAFPVPLGVMRNVQRPTYEEGVMHQVETAQQMKGKGDLRSLYCATDVWTVSEDGTENHQITKKDEVLEEMMNGWADTVTPLQRASATTPVENLQPATALVCQHDTSLADLLGQMKDKQVDCALVCDAEGKLCGTFSDQDALRVALLVTDAATVEVSQCMSPAAHTVQAHTPVARALHLMSLHRLTTLPVVDAQGKPAGVITYPKVMAYLEEMAQAR